MRPRAVERPTAEGLQPKSALAESVENDLPKTLRTVNTEKESFRKHASGNQERAEFGFDLETTSLNPRAAELVGMAICYDPSFGCYIPVGHRASLRAECPSSCL